ncbi:MAG: hypothetical protein NC828_02525 [Candidatus Omnitrophica bacterium]|nr:hypothetical protein [Candidatus Omnitrophota bacterium]
MVMYPMVPAKGIAMILVSLGIGYLVCAKAEEQKEGFVKQLGYWIGSIIIVLSILVALRGMYFQIKGIKRHFRPHRAVPYTTMPAKMMHGRMGR